MSVAELADATQARLRTLAPAAACEALFALLIAVRTATGDYADLSSQPSALFRPVPFLSWLDRQPPGAVMVVMQIVGVVAAFMAAGSAVVGRRHRPVLLVAWLAFTTLAGLRSSQGKILHNDVLLILVVVPFLLAPSLRLGGRLVPAEWARRHALVIVALAYFFTGLWKLRHTGIGWVTGDNFRYVMAWVAQTDRPQFPWIAAEVAAHPWLCHLLAGLLLTFELTFWVVLRFRALSPAYVVASIGLHAGTWLLVGLDYWSYAVIVTVLLVPARRTFVDRLPPAKSDALFPTF